MASEDEFDYKLELLRDEISHIQNKIADYDSLSFRIKGWAITLWTAILGVGIREDSAYIPLVAIPVLVAFWVLDAYFKCYQHRSMERMGYIEDFVNAESTSMKRDLSEAFNHRNFGSFIVFDPIGRQTSRIDEEFREEYEKKTDLKWCLWITPNVKLLYLSLIAVSLLGIGLIVLI